MQLSLSTTSLAEAEADVLVVTALQGADLEGPVLELDKSLGGLLSGAVADGAFKGSAYAGEWIYPAPNVKARRVLLMGAGNEQEFDARVLRQVAGAAARQANSKGATSMLFVLPTFARMRPEASAESAVDGIVNGLAGSDLYKSKRRATSLNNVAIWAGAGQSDSLAQAVERGQWLGEAVAFTRWLGDEPANIMTTVRVAEEAQKMAAENGIECDILDEDALRKFGAGSLLSVSQGSPNPPRVIVLSYKGGGDGPTLGIVGKGVVFDTGGISIKPAADMHYMKYDMCGAAAVIGTMRALAQLKVQANVIGVAGMVENMPSGTATRPGDVVRAANGKTIEITNTDAEGRLVLADALHLAITRGAERLVDIATLTGAIKVALGDVTSGAMGGPQGWVDTVLGASKEAGERVWQMPLYSEYFANMKSNIADMMNSGTRYGGALNAGAFLQQFVGETPWTHLDVAGTAWLEKERAWQDKGATGVMVRTLVKLAERPGERK